MTLYQFNKKVIFLPKLKYYIRLIDIKIILIWNVQNSIEAWESLICDRHNNCYGERILQKISGIYNTDNIIWNHSLKLGLVILSE